MAGIDTFHGLLFCLRTWMDPLFRVEKNITSLHARLSLAFASPGCNFDDFGWSNWGDFPLQTRCKSLTTWRGMVGLVTSTGGLCDDRWDWGHPTFLQWTDRIQDGDYLVVSLNQLLTYFKHLHKVHDFICSRNWSQKQQIRAKHLWFCITHGHPLVMDAFQACWASPCHITGSYRIAPLQLSVDKVLWGLWLGRWKTWTHSFMYCFHLFPKSKLLRQNKNADFYQW